MPKNFKQYTIGVDVGGTNIKFGLIDPAGKIALRSHLSTKRYIRNKNLLIRAIVAEIRDLIKNAGVAAREVRGIGFGLPGLIDPSRGVVNFLPNIPGWKNVPLARMIKDQLKVPVMIENDVNLITLGEWKFGAGKGIRNLVCMTLGTGVGGGLIINDQLYQGETFVAGEIGHMPLNEDGPACNCGGWGCFERYVGNQQLEQRAAHIFHNNRIRLEDVFLLAKQGNKRAIQFWHEVGVHIGNALVGIVNVLNPKMIIIGGGVSHNLVFMQKSIQRVIQERAMSVQAKTVKIVKARLGDDAGILGAKVLFDET